MATLIPALGACASSMTGGERRLAERLEQKLDADYLLWYDVPIGPKHCSRWWRYPAWGTCPQRAKVKRTRRGCSMWRQPGLRRGW